MKKKASTLANMAISLLCVATLSGAGVGGVYLLTKDQIQKAKDEKEQAAIKAVLPEFDRTENFVLPIADATEPLSAIKAYQNDQVVGIAVKTFSKNGFGGEIQCMVGFYPDGKICHVSVIQHSETPGLGSKMTEPDFYTQFENKKPGDGFNLQVKKDGGDVDAITASTISSRAYCEALQRAFDAYFNAQDGVSGATSNATDTVQDNSIKGGSDE